LQQGVTSQPQEGSLLHPHEGSVVQQGSSQQGSPLQPQLGSVVQGSSQQGSVQQAGWQRRNWSKRSFGRLIWINGLRQQSLALPHGSQPQEGSVLQPQLGSAVQQGSSLHPQLGSTTSHPQLGSVSQQLSEVSQHLTSQPQPEPPSIRSSKSKPKLCEQRATLATSEAKAMFSFIETRLLSENPSLF
jgi:hypothetical protein